MSPSTGNNRRRHRRRRRVSGGKIILIVVIAVVLCAAGGVLLYASHMLGKIKHVDAETAEAIDPAEETFETDDSNEPDTVAPEEVEFELPEDMVIDKDVINIMLIGQDRREGQGRQRSDSMIICSINTKTNKITLTSLMRDLYVPIPGYSDNRLNATYAFGGMKLLNDTVEQDFGVHIDGNIEVDFNGFMKAMDKIGNLDIELKDYEVTYMKKQNPNWNLKEGVNYMTSDQLLTYARIRKVGNADYERTERQRTVLMKAFNKLLASDVTSLVRAANDILPSLTTDMETTELIKLVYTIKKNGMTTGASNRIPVDGAFSSERVRGMAVLVPDLKKNRDALQAYIYG